MRPIDADKLKKELAPYEENDFSQQMDVILKIVDMQPAITPQNEPLTLISMNDEVPPDNERILVYRPCMIDSDIGPYSVQWGWAAKKDGSHWAHLPNRRPPEK